MAHLGFMLTRSLSASAGSRSFRLLAQAALNRGHQVSVIFVDDGVYQCVFNKRYNGDNDDFLSFLVSLQKNGAHLVADYASLNSRGLNLDSICTSVRVVTMEEIAERVGLVSQVVCL